MYTDGSALAFITDLLPIMENAINSKLIHFDSFLIPTYIKALKKLHVIFV